MGAEPKIWLAKRTSIMDYPLLLESWKNEHAIYRHIHRNSYPVQKRPD